MASCCRECNKLVKVCISYRGFTASYTNASRERERILETLIASKKVLLNSKNGSPSVRPAFFIIRNSLIIEVFSPSEVDFENELAKVASSGKYIVHNFGTKLITPSFVNAHTHLAMSVFRGLSAEKYASNNMIEDFFYRVEKNFTPEDITAFSRMGAFECLLNGVGLVWDHYYRGEALAKGFQDVGLAAVIAPTLQDTRGPGVDLWESALDESLHIG